MIRLITMVHAPLITLAIVFTFHPMIRLITKQEVLLKLFTFHPMIRLITLDYADLLKRDDVFTFHPMIRLITSNPDWTIDNRTLIYISSND